MTNCLYTGIAYLPCIRGDKHNIFLTVLEWRGTLFENHLKIVPLGDHLIAHGRSTATAGIVVLIPIREDKEEPLSHRHGSSALRAEKLRGVKIFVLFSSHAVHWSFSGILFASSSQIAASLSLGAR
jgi:hypothetical protein